MPLGREEVALVAAQREVRQAVVPVLLHELRPRGRGRRPRRPRPGTAAARARARGTASAADHEQQRLLDALRERVVVVGVAPRAAAGRRASAAPTCASGRTVAGSPGATNWRRARAERDQQDEVHGRLLEVEALREVRDRRGRDDARPRATRRGACAARARARARSCPSPSASTSVRAASGTPGGRTPLTRSTRSAISGVSAETIESRPAAVANHASRTGVAGRRTPHGSAVARRPDRRIRACRRTRRSSSSLPGSRIASTWSPAWSCVSSSGISALPSRTTEISRAPSGSLSARDALALAVRVLVDRSPRRSRGSPCAARAGGSGRAPAPRARSAP